MTGEDASKPRWPGRKRNAGRRGRPPADARRRETTASDFRMSGSIRDARSLAWCVLNDVEVNAAFVRESLGAQAERHHVSGIDRAAAMDMASGTIRRRRTLDRVIESVVSRPRERVEKELWTLLRLGVYQILFARTPDFAAVDSTVALCAQHGKPQWTGFVNGILRSVTRLLTDDRTSVAASDSIPVSPGEFRRLTTALFPDPQTKPADYLADAYSLPPWLAERWQKRFPPDELTAIASWAVSVPEIWIRLNRLKADPAVLFSELESAGCEIELRDGLTAKLKSTGAIDQLPGFRAGQWSVQDLSAQQVAPMLNPAPGESILDLCAAPGGKTAHLAELSDDAASIVAADVLEHRLERVDQTVRRLGLRSVTCRLISRTATSEELRLSSKTGEGFDAILVDAPCSNTGVLNRRPEVRWRIVPADLLELSQLQTRLLLTACDALRPGGRLVYSTCSIEPEENEQVVRRVVDAIDHITLEESTSHVPGRPADGGGQFLLRKKG